MLFEPKEFNDVAIEYLRGDVFDCTADTMPSIIKGFK
jgi:hypothetical protein